MLSPGEQASQSVAEFWLLYIILAQNYLWWNKALENYDNKKNLELSLTPKWVKRFRSFFSFYLRSFSGSQSLAGGQHEKTFCNARRMDFMFL